MTASWKDQEGFRERRGLRHFHRASKGLGIGTGHTHSCRCDGRTKRTCRMTWERRQSQTQASLSPSAGICPASDPQRGIVPLPGIPLQPPAALKGNNNPPSQGWDLPPWGPSRCGPGHPLPEMHGGSTSWPLAQDEPQLASLGMVCVCFRTIFLIVLFSQYLKNVAVPVPVYGGKKCHTSKFYLFQVFPVRSTPHASGKKHFPS